MNRGTCIHFNGLFGEKPTCGAGVEYAKAFDNSRPGLMLRMPCIEFRELPTHGRGTYVKAGEATIIQPVDRRGELAIPCPHRVEPTDEQIQQAREQSDAALAKHLAAIRVASAWRVKPKPQADRAEVVECPVCNGRLHLSQSACNGHVHGKCETPQCVEWME